MWRLSSGPHQTQLKLIHLGFGSITTHPVKLRVKNYFYHSEIFLIGRKLNLIEVYEKSLKAIHYPDISPFLKPVES